VGFAALIAAYQDAEDGEAQLRALGYVGTSAP